MPERPAIVPKFGTYLKRKREDRGLTPGQVEILALERFGIPLAHAVLWHYEAGQVLSPNPSILWALSRIYRISSDELLGCLAKEVAKRPIAQSDLVTPGITDRSSGLSEEAMALARAFDALPEDLRPHLTVNAEMLAQHAENMHHGSSQKRNKGSKS